MARAHGGGHWTRAEGSPPTDEGEEGNNTGSGARRARARRTDGWATERCAPSAGPLVFLVYLGSRKGNIQASPLRGKSVANMSTMM